MKRITACRVCHGGDLRQFFDLGAQPFANAMLSSPTDEEQVHPLALSWCGDCNLVQLNDTADPTDLFSHYVWVTGTSRTAREYSERFYRDVMARAALRSTGYVLEIGSNDGTFLRPFVERGHSVLGVDPAANIAALADACGVPTHCAFWDRDVARQILRERGVADLVFARNVLPHVANTHDFVGALRAVLRDEGTLAVEVHYAKTIQEELHYDSVYHEHLCYFTLKSLTRLLRQYGLHAFDISTSPISGGSIVAYASTRPRPEAPTLTQFVEAEAAAGVNALPSWQAFAQRAFAHRDTLRAMLTECAARGTIVGYGASARSSTLLNFCGIDGRFLSAVADQNPLKHGKYTPGTHLLVESPEAAFCRKPEYVFITAWNFVDEITGALENTLRYTGTCIVPLPEPYLRTVRACDGKREAP